ncbi:MAG: hypothetical protein HOP17_08955, partial [Acidobacteria bacterium]|nr:hypothetical protein [Acidobacteriota bacterium]
IDEVVPEAEVWEVDGDDPGKGRFDPVAQKLKEVLVRSVKELSAADPAKLTAARFRKFRGMGRWV